MTVDDAIIQISKVAVQVSIEDQAELCVKLMAIFGDQYTVISGAGGVQELLDVLSLRLIQH